MPTTFPNSKHGRMLEVLAGYGVINAIIEFNGGGDSGSIDCIQAELLAKDTNPQDIPITEEHAKEFFTYINSAHTLYGLLENIADKLLEEANVDWYNNDGGGGTIEICPGTGRLFVDIYVNVTERHYKPIDCSVEVLDDGVPVIDPQPKHEARVEEAY